MKKYITINTKKHQPYLKNDGNDVCLDFVMVIINIHEKNGTRVAGPDYREIRIIEVRLYRHFCLTVQLHAYLRASDRVRKKITNYAEIFRNIMPKKVLIMRKTRWIMRKIFGSLCSPKITSFDAAEIELPQKPRVCLQANFN